MKYGTIPFDGFETWYRIAGSDTCTRTPLLLLHGGPGSTHDCFEVFDHLADEEGRQIISYDQLGCGMSYLDGHPEKWVMDTWIRELINLRQALHLDRVILLGHSWGGMLTLEYVCRYNPSGVEGIVLSSTLPATWLWAEEQQRQADTLPPHLARAVRDALASGDFSGDDYREAEAAYLSRFCEGEWGPDTWECVTRPKRFGGESYTVAWGSNEFSPTGTSRDYDVISLLPSISVPALILNGEHDMCTRRVAETMAKGIPGATWKILPGCRHMSFLEDHEGYCAALTAWLRNLP